jgi:D-glycero-D-manno-heptose 1,7-bisphosphate phosphatase
MSGNVGACPELKESLGRRAVFVDRDGVINDLVYDEEEGRVGSPFSAKELRIFPYAGPALKKLRDELGFLTVLVSNQPGVAKGQFTKAEFEKMRTKMFESLGSSGTTLDGEYYCMHHPSAVITRYRKECECRKPKPGMILLACREMGIDARNSFFIGDTLTDVKAGRRAGCRTILVGQLTTFLSRMMVQEDAEPDYMLNSLKDLPDFLTSLPPRREVAAKRRKGR